MQWLKLSESRLLDPALAFKFQRHKMIHPCSFVMIMGIMGVLGNLLNREITNSASDRQGSNFESCVWRAVSSHSSHHPQDVPLAQFSLYSFIHSFIHSFIYSFILQPVVYTLLAAVDFHIVDLQRLRFIPFGLL